MNTVVLDQETVKQVQTDSVDINEVRAEVLGKLFYAFLAKGRYLNLNTYTNPENKSKVMEQLEYIRKSPAYAWAFISTINDKYQRIFFSSIVKLIYS